MAYMIFEAKSQYYCYNILKIIITLIYEEPPTMSSLRSAFKYGLIAILLICFWLIAYTTNGVNASINFFYFSIILGGFFWGAPGGIVVGIIAGIVGGPLLLDNVSNDLAQTTSQWLTRMCFYIALGLFMGKLFSSLNRRREELLSEKCAVETKNTEIIEQRDEIIKQKNEIEKQRDQIDQHMRQGREFGWGMVRALAQAIEVRDSYTSGHCQRVSDMSARIGQHMGLEEWGVIYLKWAAMVHDIGKIGIPEEILNKEGTLTPDEYDIMQRHPALGASIIKGIPFGDRVLDGVLHHHERLDGKGYPLGISGDDIGIQARIIAVCDVWDALTSNRSYRDALPYHEALKIMEEGRGTQFDSIILDHFLLIVSK
jgi:HD-GYP domain-containing protein (c-di-GMP phosphodiesterase class II)